MPDRILDAARALFHARGYAGTTMKSVAAAAGVAPTVVSSLYRNKEALFAAALRLPFDPGQAMPALIAQGIDGLGERLVRTTVQLLDDPAVRADLAALSGGAADAASGDLVVQVRSAVDVLQETLVDPIASLLGVPDARLRATLITASLAGMAGMRYVLRIEPLASAPAEQIVAMLGPGIQRLLDPTVPAA
jgi:AcrR family transcriptional regulator